MKKETVPTKKSKTMPDNTRQAARERSLFLGAVLGMSWQLAAVVLVPVLGGHALDKRVHTTPFWTAAGFVVAVIGACIVVWRQAQAVSPKNLTPKNLKEHQR
jgi:F0F1-type ATP synthase assembly protein I